ncbi:hypothetical protein [Flagellimonas sp.]|uniref:hypothetical protein n=1 Tax=Flagellimonas sp. TaxID=2058762 RepID=UPI003B505028
MKPQKFVKQVFFSPYIELKAKTNFIKPILLVALLTSCCPDGVETNKYSLTENEKGLVPYQNNKNVAMVYSSGFAFNLHTEQRTIKLNRTETHHCGDNYSTYESLYVKMQSDTPELNIEIEVTPAEYHQSANFTINQRYYFGFNTSYEPDFKNLEVNGIDYENVYLMENQFSESSIISPKEVLYNTKHGVIQITMTNNDKINLEP